MKSPFKRVLVPHDFSDAATAALRVARDLARDADGEIAVLNVIPEIVPLGSLTPSPMHVWVPSNELVADATRRLCALTNRTLGKNPVSFECRVVTGDPFSRIVAAAKKADLIAMATTGRTGLSHLLIGSVAEKIVRHSPIPVLTIRVEPKAVPAKKRAPKTVHKRVRS